MRRCFMLCALLLLAAGCQKVNMEKTVAIEPTDVQAPFIVEGPASEQTVVLTVTPESGAAVDVFIATISSVADFEKDPKIPASPLVTKKVDKEETLTATIPAKKPYVVVLANASKVANVKVKLTGK